MSVLKTRNKVWRWLLAVLLISGIFRFLGIKPGFNPYHPDEGKDGLISVQYMFSKGSLNPMDYNYPSLVPYVELVSYSVFIYPLLLVKKILFQPHLLVAGKMDLKDLILGMSDLSIMYMGRYLSAFYGLLTVGLTYLAGRKLFASRLAGVLAALVLGVNYRAIMYSHFDLPDTYSSLFLLLAFLAICQIKDNPKTKWYLISGVSIGLSFSVKFHFFALFPLVILHAYLSLRERTFWERLKSFFSRKLVVTILAFILTIISVNLYELINFQEFYTKISSEAGKYGFGVMYFNRPLFISFIKTTLTPLMAIASFLGIIIGLKKKTLSTLMIIAVSCPFLFYFLYLTSGAFYPRNFVAVIPFFALLAGYLMSELFIYSQRFKPVVTGKLLAVFLIAGILSESVINSYLHTKSFMQPWGLISMREKIKKVVEKNQNVAAHPWDWYILFSLSNINTDYNLRLIPLEQNFMYSLAELQSQNVNYALVGVDILTDATVIWWMKSKEVNLWQKPDRISKNLFLALAARELMTNTLAVAVKPWQAPDNNYVFIKVPRLLNLEMTAIADFEFNQFEEAGKWRAVDGFKGKGINMQYDSGAGYLQKGSLKILAVHSPYPVVRWVSPLISVEPGKHYQATARVQTEKPIELKDRDGFLRLDFYEVDPGYWNEETLSIKTHLSERYWGTPDWKELVVQGQAGLKDKYLTVSFQVSNPNITPYWLDKVAVFESQKVESLVKESGISSYQLPSDILVPYTLGSF